MTTWRRGRSDPLTIYRQDGPEPSEADYRVGSLRTEEDTQRAVDDVNAVQRIRELHRPVRHDAPNGPWCNACTNPALAILRGHRYAVSHPCATIRALETTTPQEGTR